MTEFALQWANRPAFLYSDGKCQGQAPDDALVLAGTATTDKNGDWKADRSVFCVEAGLLQHASLVATPTITVNEGFPTVVAPRVLTTLTFYQGGRLVGIGVKSLNPDGSVAPNVSFAWHLVVLSTFVG